jgi:hypothetical protein
VRIGPLVGLRLSVDASAILAGKVNRLAGMFANLTPATEVIEIFRQILRAIEVAVCSSINYKSPLP